jgi:hypothetical protein
MPVGSTVGVTLIDGQQVGDARCLPCAMAAGWPAGTAAMGMLAGSAAS